MENRFPSKFAAWWLIVFTVGFLISCQSRTNSSIFVESIKFYTLPYWQFERDTIKHYAELEMWNRANSNIDTDFYCQDTIIRSRHSIRHFISLVNTLEPEDTSHDYDLWSFAKIRLWLGEEHIICFGAKSGILYDGQLMKDNSEMFNFLKTEVYGPHGDEYWQSDLIKTVATTQVQSLKMKL